jgi:hypothetical protein
MMGERVMMRELRLCDKGVPGGGGGPEKWEEKKDGGGEEAHNAQGKD